MKTSESSSCHNPQLTFTEDEVSRVVDFVNLIANKATFNNMSVKDIMNSAKLYANMIQHCKVCEAHIMELKAVMEKTK